MDFPNFGLWYGLETEKSSKNWLEIVSECLFHSYIAYLSFSFFLIERSALYVRRLVKNRCSVRSFVRPFVRKIITFCGWHMRGGHTSEDSGVLKTRFLKSCKKMVKVYYPWQISLIWIHFWTLLLNFGKTRTWRGSRHLMKKMKNWENWVLCTVVNLLIPGDSRPCRARCILVSLALYVGAYRVI